MAIALYTNAVKGISSLQLGRDLDVQYKTAFVLTHKIRESLMLHRDESKLSGEVYMDGTYVNGSVKKKNKKEDRVDRRLAENQNPDKRCVVVARDSYSDGEGIGGRRTITSVIKEENQSDITRIANEFIEKDSTICADESKAYDLLYAKYDVKRVNHQKEYRSDEGVTNNLAESFFSRFKRMQYGQVHKFGTLYLENYANEVAYREDTRRCDNGTIFWDIVTKCATTRTSRDWCGYWQGNKKQAVAC